MTTRKTKGPYMVKIQDKIADEITAKGHSATLLGILSTMGIKRLEDYADYIDLQERERTLEELKKKPYGN